RPSLTRRGLRHRRYAQVVVLAEDRSLSPGPPRPAGFDPPANDQPRLERSADGALEASSRVRLARHSRPDLVSLDPGGPAIRHGPGARRLAWPHGDESGRRDRRAAGVVQRAGARATRTGVDARVDGSAALALGHATEPRADAVRRVWHRGRGRTLAGGRRARVGRGSASSGAPGFGAALQQHRAIPPTGGGAARATRSLRPASEPKGC